MRRCADTIVRCGGTALVLLVARAAASRAAEPSPRVPQFAVGVDMVSLKLVVTDARRHSVQRLGPDDLTLLEDGVPKWAGRARNALAFPLLARRQEEVVASDAI